MCVVSLLVFSISTTLYSQKESLAGFSFETKRLFLSEKATIDDAEKVVLDLNSEDDQEFSRGLFFSRFVAPRFEQHREAIERTLLKILENPAHNRFYQALETSMSIRFTSRCAERLSFRDGEDAVNLMKAFMKQKAGVACNLKPERIVSIIETKLPLPGNEKPLVDEKTFLDTLREMTTFTEIIELAISMKYSGLAQAFSEIIVDHPSNFDRVSLEYARKVLKTSDTP